MLAVEQKQCALIDMVKAIARDFAPSDAPDAHGLGPDEYAARLQDDACTCVQLSLDLEFDGACPTEALAVCFGRPSKTAALSCGHRQHRHSSHPPPSRRGSSLVGIKATILPPNDASPGPRPRLLR